MTNSASGAASCITIGNFDGVHLGHQALVSLTLREAKASNLEPVLLTFWPHPRDLLIGPGAHKPLTMPALREKLLRDCGMTTIKELKFTPALAAESAEAFVKKQLLPMSLKRLVIGHDFSLGKGREGTVTRLLELGEKFAFVVIQADAFCVDAAPVSSTRLREDLRHGKVEAAARLLGRNYTLRGLVTHGHGRGTGLGFPTANLGNIETLLPGNGVYATIARANGQAYKAVTNIGYNPTFGNDEISVESFLLEADVDLYGKEMELEFIARLRAERKFASPAALVEQIGKDIARAKAIFDQCQATKSLR